MDLNNNHFNTRNSSNYAFSYQNPDNCQKPNQFSNQRPQNMPNFGFPPNFNHSSFVPNFNPYYGSMMGYPYQTAPFNGYMSMVNEKFSSVGAPEFPEFSTQITLGGMTRANEVTRNPEESTPKSKKNQKPCNILDDFKHCRLTLQINTSLFNVFCPHSHV